MWNVYKYYICIVYTHILGKPFIHIFQYWIKYDVFDECLRWAHWVLEQLLCVICTTSHNQMRPVHSGNAKPHLLPYANPTHVTNSSKRYGSGLALIEACKPIPYANCKEERHIALQVCFTCLFAYQHTKLKKQTFLYGEIVQRILFSISIHYMNIAHFALTLIERPDADN